ncbi:MAG: hypothetical protein PVH41_06625 [Anaerolineae bacterium]
MEASGHPSINKHAFVGASVLIRTVAGFIAAEAGQGSARDLGTEGEALRRLREGVDGRQRRGIQDV